MQYVVKRDGRRVEFDAQKITNAIKGAASEIGIIMKESEFIDLTQSIIQKLEMFDKNELTVEEIQNVVEELLLSSGYDEIGNAYSNYRRERTKIREIKSDIMKTINKIGVETDRDNANVGNNFSSKLLRIASESNKWHNLASMPKHLAKAHENGDIYFHDLDSYNLTTNCLNIKTGEVLKRGFNTGYGTIKPPKRIGSAAELSCILLQSAQNDMFGGQSHVDFDNDMGYFVELTRNEIREEYKEIIGDDDKLDELVEKKLEKIVHQAMQAIVFNLNTMHSRAGSQVPFSSLNIGLPESYDAYLIDKAFLEEYEKGLGKGEQPIFPNIIFRVKEGVNREPGDPYYDLYELACRVASKRMNPMFMNIDADFNKEYYDKGYIPATMGCRTYVMSNINGEPGPDGRGNIAPCTINLPRLGILARKEAESFYKDDVAKYGKENMESEIRKFALDIFYKLLNRRLELSREALMHRYSILKNLRVKDLPFVAGEKLMKGSENLNEDDSIEPILKQGTWAIGFIGLAETLTAILGYHHGENEYARKIGIEIVGIIREYCDEVKVKDKLNYSCYATPAEGLSGKFIIQDQKLFGKIKGVTDKDYYTNSYHIPVSYKISIKDKIDIEAPYHKICNGGHITYIELDGYPEKEDVKAIIDYAYHNTNISYMGINFHMRYCKDCGHRVESYETHCPKCNSMNIQGISRVTGYLSLDERFGSGKVAERADRTAHNGSFGKTYTPGVIQ
ncbi:anaerobic ribonucleoside-triphosphate reductase [Clostridium tepidiprofundi DSM 19306]|uniref:Anaerobic ribonucleoside-triphosphate reductase n=1 Tax=Clostridium tepidiprofundi DSM 19306 TaxID=1121338 RepID=A0A151B2K6_9CLOT|nr:anaerobic ribonucleoside-triphosphate reductase [Clostridium tepidiprofundi]KYH34135.1 anaerobic ribonucleoside-triphosphate reductase [Clostridium tepidiprofundi DSM 19306]